MVSISYRLLLNMLLMFPDAASVAGADWCLAQGHLDCSIWSDSQKWGNRASAMLVVKVLSCMMLLAPQLR